MERTKFVLSKGMIYVNKKSYIVYKHTSPSNKVYIGITIQKPELRWRKGKGYKNNIHFYNAIQKYGWDNFQHEILFTGLTKDEAEQKEIELIAYYKSCNRRYGYNIDHGGNSIGHLSDEHKKKLRDANIGKCPSEDTRQKMSELFKGNNNPFYGQHHTEQIRKKMSNSHKVPIIQYSQNGNFIKIWNSAKDAGIETKINIGDITACCKGKGKTAGGYIWRYANEELTKEHLQWCKTNNSGGKKSVYQYSKDGAFIAKYDSITSAYKLTGVTISNIRSCCIGKTKSAGGFIWKYERNSKND